MTTADSAVDDRSVSSRRRRDRIACAWCGREVADSGTGRRRKYCRQSCRQRAYEQRSLADASRLPADSVVLSGVEASELIDRLFALRCAAEDVATAVAEGAGKAELVAMTQELVQFATDAERLR
jgi:hypothetical protein